MGFEVKNCVADLKVHLTDLHWKCKYCPLFVVILSFIVSNVKACHACMRYRIGELFYFFSFSLFHPSHLPFWEVASHD